MRTSAVQIHDILGSEKSLGQTFPILPHREDIDGDFNMHRCATAALSNKWLLEFGPEDVTHAGNS